MTLHMIQLTPDMVSTAVWARQNGVADADPGYLMHALLKASFGALAPKPFAVMANPGRPAKVLAYSVHAAEDLISQARAFAEPLVLQAIGFAGMAGKAMPETFASGARFGFEVRVRPIVRAARGAGVHARRERDAFLAAIQGLPADAVVDRVGVYREWLARALRPAAEIERAEPIFRQLTPVTRRDRASGGASLKTVQGPDVVFAGVLRVAESNGFPALLERGVGRHRAFGFGMLLLRPPG